MRALLKTSALFLVALGATAILYPVWHRAHPADPNLMIRLGRAAVWARSFHGVPGSSVDLATMLTQALICFGVAGALWIFSEMDTL